MVLFLAPPKQRPGPACSKRCKFCKQRALEVKHLVPSPAESPFRSEVDAFETDELKVVCADEEQPQVTLKGQLVTFNVFKQQSFSL